MAQAVSHNLMECVGLEQILQPVEPLPKRLVGGPDERFDFGVRQANMIQKYREFTPLVGVPSREDISC